MTICFYLQNRLIQTGGKRYSDTFPFNIPWSRVNILAYFAPAVSDGGIKVSITDARSTRSTSVLSETRKSQRIKAKDRVNGSPVKTPGQRGSSSDPSGQTRSSRTRFGIQKASRDTGALTQKRSCHFRLAFCIYGTPVLIRHF